MTIMVYDPVSNKVTVDRRVSFNNGHKPIGCTKVYEGLDGDRVAFAGPRLACEIVSEIVVSMLATSRAEGQKSPAALRREIPWLADDVQIYGFAKSKEGVVYYASFSHHGVDLIRASRLQGAVAYAEGNGADWFNAYRAIGKTVSEAFDLVCEHHSECGDGYDEF